LCHFNELLMEEYVNTRPQPSKNYFKYLFSFKGRATRTEYWTVSICLNLLMLPASITDEADYTVGLAYYTFIILIPIMWLSFAVVVRRLHDLDKSGWFSLLMLVPILNLVLGVYAAFFKGKDEDNKYGPSPYDI